MLPQTPQQPRERTSPLFNNNKLKLGLFFMNVGGGPRPSWAEGRLPPIWSVMRDVTVLADGAGIEAVIPLARWIGFGGRSEMCENTFETFTWAAGLAEATRHIAVFATAQVPVFYPAHVAKMGSTIDHISGGRFALNVVCGSERDDLNLFAAPELDHDTWYDYAGEWMELVNALWSSDEKLTYEGKYLKLKNARLRPKPIQLPYPPIMNAGNSPVGQRWAAQYSDMFFTSAPPGDFETMATRAHAMRALARQHRREVQIWIQGSVICRPTLREAEEYADYVGVECGDVEAVANRTKHPGLVAEVAALPAEAARLRKRELVITSYNMQPLIGTPDMIVDRMLRMSQAGVDGLNLTFVNYEEGVRQWVSEILPLMEQAGLRKPFAPVNGQAEPVGALEQAVTSER